MTSRKLAFGLVWLVVALVGCAAPRPASFAAYAGAPENRWLLWVAIHKGFHGPVYYVGSEGPYAYFRAGNLRTERFKTKASGLSLPRTFSVGQGAPYVVTSAMVP